MAGAVVTVSVAVVNVSPGAVVTMAGTVVVLSLTLNYHIRYLLKQIQILISRFFCTKQTGI